MSANEPIDEHTLDEEALAGALARHFKRRRGLERVELALRGLAPNDARAVLQAALATRGGDQ